MNIHKEAVLTQIDDDLDEWDKFSKRYRSAWSDNSTPLNDIYEMYMRVLSSIEMIVPLNSPYVTQVRTIRDKIIDNNDYSNPDQVYAALQSAIGILRALKHAISNGYLHTVSELVHADIFADFLEMAEYLLSEKYKDAAAVMIGGVLEEHIRKLGEKSGVEIVVLRDGKHVPQKTDRINSDLAKVAVYGKLEQKQITAWLDLRNNAAHGKYSSYSQENVELMLQGVRQFMLQYPA